MALGGPLAGARNTNRRRPKPVRTSGVTRALDTECADLLMAAQTRSPAKCPFRQPRRQLWRPQRAGLRSRSTCCLGAMDSADCSKPSARNCCGGECCGEEPPTVLAAMRWRSSVHLVPWSARSRACQRANVNMMDDPAGVRGARWHHDPCRSIRRSLIVALSRR